MKFYSKEIPNSPIYMPNGDPWKFETIDGVTGYAATDRQDYITHADRMITEHTGGLAAIDQAAYEAFSKKKEVSKPYTGPWREEISGGPLHDTVMSRAAVAVGETPAKLANGPVQAVDTGKPVEPAKPRVGKRAPQPEAPE